MSRLVVQSNEKTVTCPKCGQRVRVHIAYGGWVCPLCGYRSNSGGESSKEGRRMAEPSDVTRLLREASRAATAAERQRLMTEAENLRTELAAQAARGREVDLSNAIVHDHLTPVRVHEHHTAATDWLGQVATAAEGSDQEMVAQGSVWYAKVAHFVKEHPDEFEQQAYGVARRLAGAYGEGADKAEAAFLDHVGTLYARDRATGHVVVAEMEPDVGLEGPLTPMGLPLDQTSSERAPAMEALESNGSPGGNPSTSDPSVLPQQDVDAVNGDSGTRRSAGRSWARDAQPLQGDPHDPNYPWNRWGNSPHWDDHQRGYENGYMTEEREQPHDRSTGAGQAYHEGFDLGDYHQAHDIERPHDFSHFTKSMGDMLFGHGSRKESGMNRTAACPSCSGCTTCGGTHRVAVRVTGGSSLHQVQEIVDANNQPHAEDTPLNPDVAFPWELDPNAQQNSIAEAEQQVAERQKLIGRRQRAEAAAQRMFRQVMAGQDDSGWLGDMGAGGVGPGQQDGGNPGNTFPGNIADPDPVYGFGGDNEDRPLRPYGSDEATDYTNNAGMNYQTGQPTQYDEGGRGNQVGAATASLESQDPELQKALAFVRQRRALLAQRGR